jgi:flagellar hook-associated protein 2
VTGSSSISGLASGLDTATIISQLMQLEAVPQDRLKTQQAAEKAVVAALRQLNTDTSLLTGKAQALAKASTWQTLKATTTSSDVTATASSSAAATSFTVTVGTLAQAARTSYGTELGADANALAVAGDPVVLTLADGSTREIASTGTGSLKDLVAGINAEKVGVTATMVKSGTGYRLLLTADATGLGTTEISLSNVNLGAADAVKGQDATLTIGGIEARSTTNTFTDLVPGVTVTLAATAKGGTTSTI